MAVASEVLAPGGVLLEIGLPKETSSEINFKKCEKERLS